ncbi:feruloyl-CoA synthase [Methylobacterium platani]|uniref:Feruloyl-CoA synthase n=2 Tax=Methylobacterium platani TaxID=427683 RepID=A0A179SA58_9HYPH|nr:feruloyl-CoA synthase [Methylobacterium platani]KMO21873.1 feruloyl-CoA synthase [Methylobacterium platani JCM 14648]OAS24692.1 feruloyl-CoA synthase [Methylobacterium platani]
MDTHRFTERADGSLLVTAKAALPPYPERLTAHLTRHAAEAPDRPFLVRRGPGGAEPLTYGAALRTVERIAAALLTRDLSAERPVMILSGNGFEHALLSLAALHVGIAVAPVSPAYSTVSQDHARLRAIVELLTPGLVFAAEGAVYAGAIAAAVPPGTEVVTADGAEIGRPATPFADLLTAENPEAVAAAHAAVAPETVAKLLFTSGSTGVPKAVVNTHRMLGSNQAMLQARFPALTAEPPVMVDWLPWHHTFGGNHNFNLVLANGGTLHIDEGRPTPAGIRETVRALREVAPTLYLTVPKGFEALVPHLRDDAALRENFFSRLQVTFFAAAGLPQPVWDAIDDLARQTIGRTVPMVTGLGATETAPMALVTDDRPAKAGQVGLPAPGVELKVAPVGTKREARVRGPNVTPGYWRRPDLTAASFDEEGFYRLGDALVPVDPADPQRGFTFDGRLNEDFKLTTGVWVSVGPLRAAFLDAFQPLVRDVAIAGEARDEVTALVFPDLAACRALSGAGGEDAGVLADPALRRDFARRLGAFARTSTGSSNRIARLLLLAEPPALDRDEVTDKGSINQRGVLRNRAASVARLYAAPLPPDVILPETA